MPRWLIALDQQTLLPDEMIIVDGGSTDGTWEYLQGWSGLTPLQIYWAPGASISQGRNLALGKATGDIIVVTDAGTRAKRDWLERLIEPFDDPMVDASSGFFRADSDSTWSRSLAATTLPDPEEIDPNSFLPSSRSVAIRRSWIELGFRYPEWLDYCEDLIFDLRLKQAGARFVWSRNAIVAYEPRRNLMAYFQQYFRYARGDGKAGLFPGRHAIRYVTYLGALLALLTGLKRWKLLLGLALSALYLRRPMLRLWRRDRRSGTGLGQTVLALPLIPLQRLVGDAAKLLGYPVGLRWRYQRGKSTRS